ncbi:LAME_0B04852g1_1 [Lachancea meyersii CBS 8951]|uniref:Selenoprotein O n=1 Tax=Lachancea meyersii CBS 8951 TaxID=1266667 RepID=A0A1G4IV64_9SACH|nr:LAME_0B04852g1_1 [Lachancea meyersii CBS 8951]
MSEARTILGALKDSVTTRFAQSLKADSLVPSVTKAIELNDNGEENELRKCFHTPRMVSAGAHFAYTVPEQRPHYKPLLTSQKALADLNLIMDTELMDLVNGAKTHVDDRREIFPYSMAYAGFQFGQFAGQLGDGRVVNIFDLPDKNNVSQTFQLKGAGMTPFSRFADGKAVLRSSIREFVVSEALHYIGIPSTRALQLTSLPKTNAMRSAYEPCAVYCRFAPTWVRLGNFDLCRYRQDHKSLVQLADFCIRDVFKNGAEFPTEVDPEAFKHDYFPDEDEKFSSSDKPNLSSLQDATKYELFFRHVVNLNAEAVAYWQSYGFLNGVLNTDNTSIMGLAMDFGPFSFLDKFQPQYTPNHDDVELRYSFKNQPTAVWWNLTKFAQALTTLIGAGPKHIDNIVANGLEAISYEAEQDIVDRANAVIFSAGNEYKFRFTVNYARIMSQRLGLDLGIPRYITDKNLKQTAEKAEEFNKAILEPLLHILYVTQTDYNNFFVMFQGYQGDFKTGEGKGFQTIDPELLKVFFTDVQVLKLNKHASGTPDSDSGETRLLVECAETLESWIHDYTTLMPLEQSVRFNLAKQVNPLFTPRAYIFEQVINSITEQQKAKLHDPDAEIDISYLQKLYNMSVNPYDPEKWDDNLHPEVVADWTTHGDDDTKFMKQLTCSS